MPDTKLPLSGRRVLIVEDDYLLAEELAAAADAAGAEVVGPVGRLGEALGLVHADVAIDAAIVDMDLAGERADAVLDALIARTVPIVLNTGGAPAGLAPRFRHLPRLRKPSAAAVVAALASAVAVHRPK